MSALTISVVVPRRGLDVRADLVVAAGERIALFGPSGAGKTTLLDTVAGLVEPSEGEVKFGQELLSRPAMSRRRRRRAAGGPTEGAVRLVSIVRQPATVFPHVSVEANLGYGRSDPALVDAMLRCLELGPLRRARPGELSGGQVQRVALGRALARRFSVLLLDEPFSALDAPTRRLCREAVDERCSEEGAASVLVTHDLREAQGFGHRLAVIDGGAVLAEGDPHAVVADPGTRRVAELVGYVSFLRLRDRSGGVRTLAVDPDRFRIEAGGAGPPAWPSSAAGSMGGGPWLQVSGTVLSCRPSGTSFEARLLVPDGADVATAAGARYVTEGASEIPAVVTGAVPVGKEQVATATMPPVVAT